MTLIRPVTLTTIVSRQTVSINRMDRPISYSPQSREELAINLRRALSRLERKILASPPDARLKHSSYERAKTSAVSMNFPYAAEIPRHHIKPPLCSQPHIFVVLTRHCEALESRIRPHAPAPSGARSLVDQNTIP